METKIRVAILDDHQTIVDGYVYRLERSPEIEITGTAAYGEDLEPLLATHPSDVLLLDVSVPTSSSNPNPYPILHLIPRLQQAYPDMAVLVISMHADRSLIKAVVDAGVSGYILKDDQPTLRNLSYIVSVVARGGIHFSPQAHQVLIKNNADEPLALSPRQLEALSLSAAYPNLPASAVARLMNITTSTVRNLLSIAYIKLDVNNRTAATLKARQLGLITPLTPPPPTQEVVSPPSETTLA